MSGTKFEMHQYRQVLIRMRNGDSDRDIGRSGVVGWKSAVAFRTLAIEQNWLSADLLPDDAANATALANPMRACTTVYSLGPLREQIAAWFNQCINGFIIHAALKHDHAIPACGQC